MPPSLTFADLVGRQQPAILRYLTRLLGDENEAQDVCQDTFFRAQRAFARLGGDSNARAWLYKIATNCALNAARRRRRQNAHKVDVDLDMLPARSGRSSERREQLRAVAGAVDGLPPKQRAALMLRKFDGFGYAEIAASLGGSEAAARANVYQAMKKLRTAVRR